MCAQLVWVRAEWALTVPAGPVVSERPPGMLVVENLILLDNANLMANQMSAGLWVPKFRPVILPGIRATNLFPRPGRAFERAFESRSVTSKNYSTKRLLFAPRPVQSNVKSVRSQKVIIENHQLENHLLLRGISRKKN